MNFPAKIYNPAGTMVIGIAYNMTDALAIVNSNSLWQAYGTVVDGGSNFYWFAKSPATTIVQPILDQSITGQAVVGGQQFYQLNVTDATTGNAILNSQLPANIYVNVGSGNYYLGYLSSSFDIANALTTYINTISRGAAVMTIVPNGTCGQPLSVIINNITPTAFNNTITLTADLSASQYLLLGSNNSKATTAESEPVFDISNNSYVGRLPVIGTTNVLWHTITVGNKLLTAEGNTGFVYIFDISNPLQPNLLGTIQLSNVTGSNFAGTPKYTNKNWYYSLYFITDFNSIWGNLIYITESLTGTIWQINLDTLTQTDAFHSNYLIGKCPRVLINRNIWFSQDGNLESATSQNSGIAQGNIVIIDTSSFSSHASSITSIAVGVSEYIIAGAYDGQGNIYYVGDTGGGIYKVNVKTQAIVSNVNIIGANASFVNATYYKGQLFICSQTTGSKIVNLSTFATPTAFQSFSTPHGTNISHYNFKVLPSGLGILTFTNGGNNAGCCKFDIAGNFIAYIPYAGDIFNVIAVPKPISNISNLPL